MGGNLNERFEAVVYGVARSYASYTAANETTGITNGKVDVEAKPRAGLTYRVTMAGTKSGANAAMSVQLQLGSTTLITIAADGNDAVDWIAEFLLIIVDSKNQRVAGRYIPESADPAVDYAAATIDLTAGGTLTPQIISGHASDTVTCTMCVVEAGY